MQSDVSEVCRRAVGQLAGANIDVHRAALRELRALADEHPVRRQQVAEAVCRYLREPVAHPGDPSAGVRAVAVGVLAALARAHPAEGAEHLDVDLSGALLPDVDFSGCRFGEADFADARFLGACTFDGACFTGEALFQRSVFDGEARFSGTGFDRMAVFGRTRFRGTADFSGARFQGIAWFGRGEDEFDEDDPAWEEAEERRPVPWDELNEDDPHWPMMVLEGDYQDWEEGGDGARFNGRVSFTDARFAEAAWFWKARFGGEALFHRAVFGGRVHLEQPAADLTDARVSDATRGESQDWPLGWSATMSGTEGGRHGRLIPDESVAPYHRQLAAPDPDVRLTGVGLLGALGDLAPGLRQRVADTLCAYLRTPLAFEVTSDVFALSPSQFGELRARHAAQRLLADRTRPSSDRPFWEGIRLGLSGATLIDLDLSGCRLAYGDFTGTQFYGNTTFAGATFGEVRRGGIDFCLPGGRGGRAAFHGRADFSGARLRQLWGLGHCVFHADTFVRETNTKQDLVRMLLGARGTADPGDLTGRLRQAFLTAGSETPDNLTSVRHLAYGPVPGPPYAPESQRSGLKIADTDVLVSDVAWNIEGTPIPASVAEAFPELTAEQWDAATRVITMLLSALDAD
ncbi:pentapeptide repeat-containing protein [Streptomyces sp. NPDC096132]|uniref:pentapeptide repeat-containing protein n=1 Tax=Streptomyces sp. NPDC096132 TaxID=3366075 RepID=UPI00382257FF